VAVVDLDHLLTRSGISHPEIPSVVFYLKHNVMCLELIGYGNIPELDAEKNISSKEIQEPLINTRRSATLTVGHCVIMTVVSKCPCNTPCCQIVKYLLTS
jgi:hypothetical protein